MRERWGISGSNGFIGSHLVEKLQEDGYEVVLITRSGFVPRKLDRLIDTASFGNMSYQIDPIQIYTANVIRVIDILNQSEGIKSIILTSTSSVELPYQTLYSASKKAMEDVSQIYKREKGLPITVIRPLSIYGVGEQKEHLIPKLIDSCLNGTQIPFVGEPKHDFLYVDDFIKALIEISDFEKERGSRPYKVGSGHLISNEEVKDVVEKITGKKANLKRVDSMRKYDTSEWPTGDNWSKVSLEEGIRRMIHVS